MKRFAGMRQQTIQPKYYLRAAICLTNTAQSQLSVQLDASHSKQGTASAPPQLHSSPPKALQQPHLNASTSASALSSADSADWLAVATMSERMATARSRELSRGRPAACWGTGGFGSRGYSNGCESWAAGGSCSAALLAAGPPINESLATHWWLPQAPLPTTS